MALQFDPGAYMAAVQNGQNNEQNNDSRMLQLLQTLGQGISGYQQNKNQMAAQENQSNLQAQQFDMQKKQFDLQKRTSDLENTSLGKLMSSNRLSSPVAPQSMIQQPQNGMGEAMRPQRMNFVEQFRQLQRGNKLNAPQTPQEQEPMSIERLLSPENLPKLSLKQIEMISKVKENLAKSTPDSLKTPGSLDAVLANKVNSGEITMEAALEMKRKMSAPSAGTQKPPTGFRWTSDGSLESIPGGPADAKQQMMAEKESALKQGQLQKAESVIAKVDQALEKVGITTAGMGSNLSFIPGTTAKDLEADIQTIKANLGFNELQEMRRNSPTGGALGQVAVQELQALQATVASLDQAQSPEQLRERLGEIKRRYMNWVQTLQGEMSAGGEMQKPGGLPQAGMVKNGYRFRGGNPADKNNWEKLQ